jgi:hypothetical protein
MEIKRYHSWLFEKQNPISDCGCQNHGFITESISYDEVMAKHNELEPQSITEAGTPTEPFVAGKGGSSGDILCLYASGFYSVDHTDAKGQAFTNSTKFKPIVDKMVAFLKAEPKKSWVSEVIIKSSESIVPNFDMEKKSGAKPIGWLSEQRKQKIQLYINQVIQPLVADGTVSKLPVVKLQFEEAKTLTEPSGGWDNYRAWNKETDPAKKAALPNNAEYTKLKKGYDNDQKTVVQFKVIQDLGAAQCTVGVRIVVSYDDKANVGHGCDFANYEITANGIPLTTYGVGTGSVAARLPGQSPGGWIPGGTPYASMSNSQERGDVLYKSGSKEAENGGVRKNFFWLYDTALIKRIVAAGDGKSIILKATCIVNGSGYGGKGGCHTDAPHVFVYQSNGTLAKGFEPSDSHITLRNGGTYPKTDNGIIAELDLCGNNKVAQKAAVASSEKTKTATQVGPKLTGVKMSFAAKKVGTLNSEQALQNLVSNGSVTKNADNTYLVNKDFVAGDGDIKYMKGDVINKILPKGSVITRPATPNAPK